MENGHYKLFAGKTVLKDFGSNYRDLLAAKRVIVELGLNAYGVIGSPDPVMEYWLRNGQAPPVTNLSRTGVSFDPERLSVRKDDGAYIVRDQNHVIFNFGPYAEDADRAVAVIRKYEFNEVAYVGLPNPSMIYMLRNDSPSHPSRSHGDSLRPEYLPQHATRYPFQIPGLGVVGERRPVDAMRLETQRAADGWHLMSGPTDLGNVSSNEYQARTAMQVAQGYPFTEFVRIGASDFTFFLSRNQAPRDLPLGVRGVAFDPKLLTAKQTPAGWSVTDGKNTVATLHSPADAETAIKVIQYYKFNSACSIGAMHFMVRENRPFSGLQ